MARFTKSFTLKDIFNNRNLKNKLPLINYKEKEREDGKTSYRTYLKTVGMQVYETSKRTARPFYKTFLPSKSGDTIILTGDLDGDHDKAVDAVYQALYAQRFMYIWTANHAQLIRDALKESEKNRRRYGIDTKLYLRANSMQEIEGMSRPQLQALVKDVLDNVLYGDNFPETQRKWKVQDWKAKQTYEQRKTEWQNRVGE